MSQLFYMDHQVPSAVTKGLQRRGIDVLTTEEDQRADWDDESLLRRATELNRVVFTQDDDFIGIGHEWQQTGKVFMGIVYAHQLRVTIGQIVIDLELIANAMTPTDMKNRIEFLPLG